MTATAKNERITNPITELLAASRQDDPEARARALRPGYFARRDALLASGAFAVEDLRLTHPPTGRRYAD